MRGKSNIVTSLRRFPLSAFVGRIINLAALEPLFAPHEEPNLHRARAQGDHPVSRCVTTFPRAEKEFIFVGRAPTVEMWVMAVHVDIGAPRFTRQSSRGLEHSKTLRVFQTSL